MYAIAKLGPNIVPRGDDLRWVSERATAGRPARPPNCYGVPFLEADKSKRKRKRGDSDRCLLALADHAGPSSPRAARSQSSSAANYLSLV